jgi:haloalkane dehalogenase
MRVLRTPPDCFAGLPGFDYEPHYADIGDLRMAYVQAGPEDGEPVLLLHGEPSWSFLYRTIMPVLADAGLRAIAPDLVGFGRSDKPAEIGDHSYARHVEWTRRLAFDVLGLHGVTLVGQDWGGLIGLRLVAEHPDRFARVVTANTGLPTGDLPMPDVWLRFRDLVRTAPELSVSRLVSSGCIRRTTHRSPARSTWPVRARCLASSRRIRTIRRRRPTGEPGNGWRPGTSRSSWRSATPTRSPVPWRRYCSDRFPAPPGSSTQY